MRYYSINTVLAVFLVFTIDPNSEKTRPRKVSTDRADVLSFICSDGKSLLVLVNACAAVFNAFLES